jgi:hypothetical protein
VTAAQGPLNLTATHQTAAAAAAAVQTLTAAVTARAVKAGCLPQTAALLTG